MKKYKAVILGCGPRAYKHAQAYQYVERGELTACCDLDQEKRDKFTARFKIKGYSDLAEMIAEEKPDLIHLVTPPSLRVQLMEEIDRLGVPACLVEKPIALGVADYKALLELEKRASTKFAVNHQFRYHSTLTKCRELLESGKLGKRLFMEFTARMNISNQGTHVLDYIMSLNDDSPVVRVFGNASGIDKEDLSHPAPETVAAQVVFENGVYGLWSTGFLSPKVLDDAPIYMHCREAVYAEKGRILWEEFKRWEILSPDGLESGSHTEDIEKLNDMAQAGLTESMFDWLEDDQKPSGTNLKRSLHQ